MNTLKRNTVSRRANRGISLLVVLMMLVIIGVTASTAMRNATSGQRATNNLRMEASALQYAEAALRYCESEMKKDPVDRVDPTLQGVIPVTAFGPNFSGWEDNATWTGSGGRASSTRTAIPIAKYSNVDTVAPNKGPECVVENMTSYGIVITARGFSPDYTFDAGTGKTLTGAVVWLQSFQ